MKTNDSHTVVYEFLTAMKMVVICLEPKINCGSFGIPSHALAAFFRGHMITRGTWVGKFFSG